MATTSNPPRAFQGPLLFVNHDADHMKAKPHRQRVFNHVQNNYRRWKRQEDAKALRASVKLPTSLQPPATGALQKPRDGSTVQIQSREIIPLNRAATYRSQSSRSSELTRRSTEDDTDESQNTELALTLTTSPTSSLSQGNSDPFNAYPIEIKPEVNDIMTFYRDYVLPSMYNLTSTKSVTYASAMRDWQDIKDGLEDQGSSFGFLARYALVAARYSPAMAKLAAFYRIKSTKLLRDKVSEGQDLNTFHNSWHIHMLCGAEIIGGNLTGSLVHGNMLRYLLTEQSKKGRVDYKLLMYALYNDCQLTSMFFVRPVFDVEGWLPKVLAPIWAMAAPHLPEPSDVVMRIDPSIDNADLQSIFIARRHSIGVLLSGTTKEQSPEAPLILMWIMSRAFLYQGKMINHYLDFREKNKNINSLTAEMQDHIAAQQYLTLAGLQWTRGISFNTKVLGITIYDASPGILVALKSILQQSERSVDHPGWEMYKNARLWAFFVGAHAEQTLLVEKNTIVDKYSGRSPDDWYTTRLVGQAAVMGLVTWKSVEQVLEGFLYNSTQAPNGSLWFENAMDAASPPPGRRLSAELEVVINETINRNDRPITAAA